MRTRMMALFALIAFCAMPIEAKKVKGNGDIITKEISVRDYSAIKVGSTDRKSTRLNSSHRSLSRMPSSA